MPTYVYQCEKCGFQFEKFQSIAAAPLTLCPKEACDKKPWGKGKVKRVISGGAGLLFKGSGFYITDYRSDKYKEAAKKDTGTPAAKPAETKSADAKPAAAKSDTPKASPSAKT
jgi:putative FmdB family regulatory protein